MTGAQASYLKTLSEPAHDPEGFQEGLRKPEARSDVAFRGKPGLGNRG